MIYIRSVLFFVLVAALVPFGVGPAPETLARLAPGALFAAALLAALLPLDRLFGADAEDGTLDQLLLSGLPRGGIAAAKALGHWITTGLPVAAANRATCAARSSAVCTSMMKPSRALTPSSLSTSAP